MIDFRNYSDLIRKCVAEENEKDKNWKWSVRSIGKNKVRIRWGYLDYLEEKNNCFSITANGYSDDDFVSNDIVYRHPSGGMISFTSFGKMPGNTAETIEEAIEQAIRGIARYAHSRY